MRFHPRNGVLFARGRGTEFLLIQAWDIEPPLLDVGSQKGCNCTDAFCRTHGKAVSYASIAELFPDWFWPAGPARPGLGVQKPGPARPGPTPCAMYALY